MAGMGFPVAELACVLLALGALAYGYFRWQFSYWRRRKVVCDDNPSFPWGSIGEVVLGRRYYGDVCMDLYARFSQQGRTWPGLAGFWNFSRPVLLVCDPELIKHILVKQFHNFHDRGIYHDEKKEPLSAHMFAIEGNDGWKFLRSKISPAFTQGKLKLMFDQVREETGTLERVIKDSPNGLFETRDLMAKLTTDIIISTAFGLRANTLTNEADSPFRYMGRRVFNPTMKSGIRFLSMFVYHPLNIIFKFGMFDTDVTRMIYKVVEDNQTYRNETNTRRGDFFDFLQQLLKTGSIDGPSDGKKITQDQMVAQANVFFLAGFETTSSALQFTLYHLALHPDVQRRAREECAKVMAKNDGQISFEMLEEVPYTEMVIKETLRLYPSLTFLDRVCTTETVLPNGFTVEKGTKIIIPSMGIHRDPNLYPDPDKFDPERFSKENSAGRHPYSYLPFGEGPRICIGMRFAWMVLKTTMLTVLPNYDIEPCKDTPRRIVLDAKGFIPFPQGGMPLKITPRK